MTELMNTSTLGILPVCFFGLILMIAYGLFLVKNAIECERLLLRIALLLAGFLVGSSASYFLMKILQELLK